VAYSATGGDSEHLRWHTWQLFPVMKKTAHLEVVDQHTGGWGHILIDQITMTAQARVSPYVNDAVTLAMTSQMEAAPRAEADATHPVFHFAAPAYWMNDPNGPVYFKDYYHIFYQHNPFGEQWGHMHWGHARSRDLITWKHLPIALWPSKELGEEHVFSGCATTNNRGELITLYTSIGNRSASDYAEQWAALGDNLGNTFEKHRANPILSEKLHGDLKVYDWRDPFIFRHQGVTYLVCGGNLNQAKGGQAVVLLYEALNGELTQWKFRGELFRHPDSNVKNIECPNFFKLGSRWVLIISPHAKVQYFTGDFDPVAGKFTYSQRGLMDYGDSYYAPNCMEDLKGRRILWGWLRGFKDGRGWNGCLTLPRILNLEPDGSLGQIPVPELSRLQGEAQTLGVTEIRHATNFVQGFASDTFEIDAEIECADAQEFGFLLRASLDGSRAVPLVQESGRLRLAATSAPLPKPEPGHTVRLRIFSDHSVFEVYANGRLCLSQIAYPDEKERALALYASGGGIKLRSFKVWPMQALEF
jgi:beta-fructofuranosidase